MNSPGHLVLNPAIMGLSDMIQTETSYSELTNKMVTQETIFKLVDVADLTYSE